MLKVYEEELMSKANFCMQLKGSSGEDLNEEGQRSEALKRMHKEESIESLKVSDARPAVYHEGAI